MDIKSCSLHSVVVYKDRAEIKRNVTISLKAGESEIKLTGLAKSVDSDSIRVEGRGNATILDVIYETVENKMTDADQNNEEFETLQGELEEKEKDLTFVKYRQNLIERQKEMLKEFADHVTSERKNGSDKQDTDFQSSVQPQSVTGVIEFMSRYQDKMSSLDERLFETSSQEKKLEEEIAVLKEKSKQMAESFVGKETVSSVCVVLKAKEETDIVIIVSYVVKNASWSPTYDVRVFTKDKSMKLHYHGLIKQSTGEDWDNAIISLSTAQPDVGGSAPQLNVHHIGFKRAHYVTRAYKSKAFSVSTRKRGYSASASLKDNYLPLYEGVGPEVGAAPSLEVDTSTVDANQLYNASFTIPRTACIPSDSTEHRVTVAIIDLEPKFSYVAVPRLSPSTYLQAEVKNASAYSLLGGPANVFLDNNFLAKSEVPNTSPNENFTTSLGVDESIRISVQPMNIVRGTAGRINKNNHLVYTFLYSVKNTQDIDAKVKVMEQIPLSPDEKLKVIVQDPELKKQNVKVLFSHGRRGHSVLNDDNNIEWHCTIQPGESVDLQLVYAVEFPPYDMVTGLPNT